MIIILIGPPGSGKSTQAEKVAKKLKLPHISMGQVLREAKESKTIVGVEAGKYMDEGSLVPSNIIRFLTKFRLREKDCSEGFVLDGAPRRVEEAVVLDDFLSKMDKKIDIVILLEVSDKTLIKRLLKRSELPKSQGGGRADDEIDDIKVRIREYKDNIDTIKTYYNNKDILEIIDGEPSIDDVAVNIGKLLQL